MDWVSFGLKICINTTFTSLSPRVDFDYINHAIAVYSSSSLVQTGAGKISKYIDLGKYISHI